ncbi:hypothetical protein, partial [Shewanella sp. MBTL60-112-B1]|uniref:hypothetical protein n=1 Tax=Shewanella sp. MBTL60-112-B1 TaxID=2815916 RepID=UPI001C7D27CC
FSGTKVLFKKVSFGGNADFSGLTYCNEIEFFDLSFSTFGKSLDLSDNLFSLVPDLTYTKLTNHAALDHFYPQCIYENRFFFFSTVKDRADISRLRRLKELAESAKDHERALMFHSEELKAKRWKESNAAQSILDIIFSIVSNYGRSIARPMFILLILITTITRLYVEFDAGKYKELSEKPHALESAYIYSLTYTLSNSMPFFPGGKGIIKESKDNLKNHSKIELPKHSGVINIFLGIFSTIFLFLIGLALRNRFRL